MRNTTMQNRMLFGTLALLLCSLAFTAPATAVNIPGCGEFVLLSETAIRFEQGPTELFGNVLVTSPAGLIQVGAHNIIHGTITANTLNLGTASQVDRCEGNVFLGVDPTTVCGSIGPAIFPTCPAFPPIPAPTVDACVDSAPDQTFSSDATLPAGACVGALRVNAGVTLTVTGTINVKRVLLKAGANLIGPATINVKGQFLTESGTLMEGLTLNLVSTANEVLSLGVGSSFLNGLINAPFGGIHLHSNLKFDGSEAVSKRATVEPIKNVIPPRPTCPCVKTFSFAVEAAKEILTINGVDLTGVTEVRLSSAATCDTTTGLALLPPYQVQNDGQIKIDVGAVPAGTYHVISVSAGNTCCTNATVTIP